MKMVLMLILSSADRMLRRDSLNRMSINRHIDLGNDIAGTAIDFGNWVEGRANDVSGVVGHGWAQVANIAQVYADWISNGGNWDALRATWIGSLFTAL